MKRFTFLLFCLLVSIGLVSAQTRVTGIVIDADDGQPVIGASVVVKGATNVGTVTNVNGEFTLNVPSGATTLVVSYIGMVTRELAVSSNMRILLESDSQQLDEVVVTALGISRERKSLAFGAQEMGGEMLSVAKDPNLLKSIAGKISGVNISSTTGALGSSARIQIRGVSSFTGSNQPLFVVDGSPILNERIAINNVDFGNNAGQIDPETIESMTILKGPSATALYGSRALNGAVIITTKQGQVGRRSTDITFSSGLTVDRVSTMPRYQNMYGQGAYGSEFDYNKWLAAGNTGSYQQFAASEVYSYVDGMGGGVYDDFDESWGPRLDAGLMLDQFHGKNQPWVSHPNNIRDIYDTGVSFTNSLTFSASAENIAGRITYTNDNLSGVFPNTGLKRNNINANLVIDYGKWVKAEINVTYLNANSDNMPGGGYNSGNPMQMAGWFGRQVDTKLLKENWNTFFENTGYPYNWISIYHNNPWFSANKILRGQDQNRVYGNVGLTFTFTPDLKLITRVGYDHNSIDIRSQQDAWDIDLARTNNGSFEWNTRRWNELNMDAFLNYSKYAGDFSVSAMAGANFREYNHRYARLNAEALIVPNFFTIGNVRGNPTYSYTRNLKQTNSVFGSVNVGFKNWLYVDVTARNDWTSALSPGNWSYFYPSAGLSFVFSDALDIQSNILSFGKIRASWAQVGSDADAYDTSMTYAPSVAVDGWNRFSYAGAGAAIATLVDPLLRPQRKTGVEIGADLRFLNNRINLDVTWFRDRTSDQIMTVPISYASGFSQMRINAGVIQNTGLEVTLSGKILENRRGLNWTSTINWSTLRGTVLELYGDINMINLGHTWNIMYLRAVKGERFGDMYAYVPAIDEASGKPLTRNGEYVRSAQMEKLGNALPDWIAGWQNEFRYQNFNLSFLFNGKIGGTMFPMSGWFGMYSGVLEETVRGGVRENGVLIDGIDRDTGQPNTIRISPQDHFGWGGGSVWVIPGRAALDASFIKLQEIVFGYNLPDALTRKTGFVKGANLSFVARNVALLYIHKSNYLGIDPDTMRGVNIADLGQEDYSAPPVRSLGLKLTLNF